MGPDLDLLSYFELVTTGKIRKSVTNSCHTQKVPMEIECRGVCVKICVWHLAILKVDVGRSTLNCPPRRVEYIRRKEIEK